MNKLKKLGAMIEKLYMGVGAAAMGLLAFLVIFTVIMRYCFSLSWKSVSEFNVLLFTFTTFWGLGLNVLKNEHVAVTILYDVFPPVVKKWVSVLNYIVMLVVDVLFIKYGWAYAIKMGKQLSNVLKFVPEVLGHIITADGRKQTARILDRRPLKHSLNRNVEHYRIHLLEQRGIEYSRLTEAHPMFDARLDNDALGDALREGIFIELRRSNRIARASPMVGRHTAARLRHAADIYYANIFAIRLCENGFHNVGRNSRIHIKCLLGIVIGRRRHHAADIS